MATHKETMIRWQEKETAASHVPVGRWALVLFAVATFMLAVAPSPASAAIYRPLTFDDWPLQGCWPDPCSLREAVIRANNHPGEDEIRLAAGTYTLSQVSLGNDTPADGDLDITRDRLTITGAGGHWGGTVVDAATIDRAVDIAYGASLTITSVVIANGDAKPDPRTGHAHGGGIHNHGTLVLENSALVSNWVNVPGWGGGGLANAGWARLRNVTVARNEAPPGWGGWGGGIENRPGSASRPVRLYLQHVTVAENGQGGGIAQSGWPPNSTVTLANTIVAHNLGYDCLWGFDIYSTDNYLDSDGWCDTVRAPGVIYLSGVDPRFAVTSQSTGWVIPYYQLQTLWPPMGWQQSPAIDAAESCLANHDQIGIARPTEGDGDGTAECDLGASEWTS